MGEQHHAPFQLSFNSSLRVDSRGSWVTSDGGLMLVRELEERLGMSALIEQHLTDTRRGRHTPFPLADWLRQSVDSRLAGDEEVNDAERVSADPTVRLIGSETIWERGAALTSRWHAFEMEVRKRSRVCGAEGQGGSAGFGRHGRGRTSPLGRDRGYARGKMSLAWLEGRHVGVSSHEARRSQRKSWFTMTWLAIRLGAAEKCTVTLLSRHPLVTPTNPAEGRHERPYTSPWNFLRRSLLWNA
jgi:hypothetical protein